LADELNIITWIVVGPEYAKRWVIKSSPGCRTEHDPPPGDIPDIGTEETTLALEPDDNKIVWTWHIGDPRISPIHEDPVTPTSWFVAPFLFSPPYGDSITPDIDPQILDLRCYIYDQNFYCRQALAGNWEVMSGSVAIVDSPRCSRPDHEDAWIIYDSGYDDVQVFQYYDWIFKAGVTKFRYKEEELSEPIEEVTTAEIQRVLRALHTDLAQCVVTEEMIDIYLFYTITTSKDTLPALPGPTLVAIWVNGGVKGAQSATRQSAGYKAHWRGWVDAPESQYTYGWNDCEYGCNPLWPEEAGYVGDTEQPNTILWDDGKYHEYRHVGCTCENQDKVVWQKVGAKGGGRWEVAVGQHIYEGELNNCRQGTLVEGGIYYGDRDLCDCPKCEPPYPTELPSEYDDGVQIIKDCANPRWLECSDGYALCNYGKEKFQDLYVETRCPFMAYDVEHRIYFNNGGQYAFCVAHDYFVSGYSTLSWLEFGIFDGSNRHARAMMLGDTQYPGTTKLEGVYSVQLGLWLHTAEKEGESAVASILLGQSVIKGMAVASYIPEITDHRVGLGTGGGTGYFNWIKVSEAKRAWDDTPAGLTAGPKASIDEDHPCYMPIAGFQRIDEGTGLPVYSNDPYWRCPTSFQGWWGWSYQLGLDGVYPDSITVEVTGVVGENCSDEWNGVYELRRDNRPYPTPGDYGILSYTAGFYSYYEEVGSCLKVLILRMNMGWAVVEVGYLDKGDGECTTVSTTSFSPDSWPTTDRISCLGDGPLLTDYKLFSGSGAIDCSTCSPGLSCSSDFSDAVLEIIDVSPGATNGFSDGFSEGFG
jgi:hypothetical protein